MPPLIRLARAEGARVHILETAAPLGTGEFTSNPVHSDDYPTEAPSPATSGVNPADRPAAADTLVVAAETNAYLEAMAGHLKARGVEAVWDWQPDFRRDDLAAYARQVGAGTVALVHRHLIAELIQQHHIRELEAGGLRVVELEPER